MSITRKLTITTLVLFFLLAGIPLPSPQDSQSPRAQGLLSLDSVRRVIVRSVLQNPSPAGAQSVSARKLFSATAIIASGSSTSAEVDLRTIAKNGAFAVWYTITGAGTAKIEYLTSATSGGTFIEPADASDIATGKTVGSYHASFNPIVTPFIKIKVTETGGAQAIGVTLYLVIQ